MSSPILSGGRKKPCKGKNSPCLSVKARYAHCVAVRSAKRSGKKSPKLRGAVGTRAQVLNGSASRTVGGLRKNHLDSAGKSICKKKSGKKLGKKSSGKKKSAGKKSSGKKSAGK